MPHTGEGECPACGGEEWELCPHCGCCIAECCDCPDEEGFDDE